jgi:hypothetical protein
MPRYINIYRTDQVFGGPEEGGWYFTQGEPHASIPILPEGASGSSDRWQSYVDELNKDLGWTYEGTRYVIFFQPHQAKAFPSVTPHYE